jgi:vacuolar protein-sorting-associated protein 4
MSYVDFVTPAIQHAKEAASADENKQYKEAYALYLKAIDHFMMAIKRNFLFFFKKKDEKGNSKRKDLLKQKATEILERAEQIKEYLKNDSENGGDGKNPKGATKQK